MMYKRRRWCVGLAEDPEDLARKLTQRTWTLCTGFYVRGHEEYLFLNDATSEDSAVEIAIVKGRLGADRHVQLESITASWCSCEEVLAFIREALAGLYDASEFASPVSPTLETPGQHGRCPLCA